MLYVRKFCRISRKKNSRLQIRLVQRLFLVYCLFNKLATIGGHRVKREKIGISVKLSVYLFVLFGIRYVTNTFMIGIAYTFATLFTLYDIYTTIRDVKGLKKHGS